MNASKTLLGTTAFGADEEHLFQGHLQEALKEAQADGFDTIGYRVQYQNGELLVTAYGAHSKDIPDNALDSYM